MKKLMLIFTMMLTLSVCSSCVATAVAQDEIYTNDRYYDDALYVGYEIVWVNNWPYWFSNNVFIPYHHTHVLPKYHSYRIERRPYKPMLRHGHYNPYYDTHNYWRYNQRNQGDVHHRTHPGHPNNSGNSQQVRPPFRPQSQPDRHVQHNNRGGHFNGGHPNTSHSHRK